MNYSNTSDVVIDGGIDVTDEIIYNWGFVGFSILPVIAVLGNLLVIVSVVWEKSLQEPKAIKLIVSTYLLLNVFSL